MQVEEIEKLIDSIDSFWISLWPSLLLLSDYQIHMNTVSDFTDVFSTISQMVISEAQWQDRFESTRTLSSNSHSLNTLRSDWFTLRNRRSEWVKFFNPNSIISYTERNGSIKRIKVWEGVIEMISTTQFYRGHLSIQLDQLSITTSAELIVAS
jgi:hypothetical protein